LIVVRRKVQAVNQSGKKFKLLLHLKSIVKMHSTGKLLLRTISLCLQLEKM
jgi:hypothetical protein